MIQRAALVLLAAFLAGIGGFYASQQVKPITGVYYGTVLVVNGTGEWWAEKHGATLGAVNLAEGLVVLYKANAVPVNARNLTCTPTTGLVEGRIVALGEVKTLEGGEIRVGPFRVVNGKALLLNACLYKP